MQCAHAAVSGPRFVGMYYTYRVGMGDGRRFCAKTSWPQAHALHLTCDMCRESNSHIRRQWPSCRASQAYQHRPLRLYYFCYRGRCAYTLFAAKNSA